MLGSCPSFGSFSDTSNGGASASWSPSGDSGTLTLDVPASGGCGAGTSNGGASATLALSGARAVRIEVTEALNDDYSNANSLFIRLTTAGAVQTWKTDSVALDACPRVDMILASGTNPDDITLGCSDTLEVELQADFSGATATIDVTLYQCTP